MFNVRRFKGRVTMRIQIGDFTLSLNISITN